MVSGKKEPMLNVKLRKTVENLLAKSAVDFDQPPWSPKDKKQLLSVLKNYSRELGKK